MKRIVLSTSSSCLNYIKAPHNIRMIPCHMVIDGVSYLEVQEIDAEKLGQMLRENPNLRLKTAPPTDEEIIGIFENLYREGYKEVLICTISSKLSKTHELFEKLKSRYVGYMDIYVYDTKTLNIDEGALAFEADLMFQEGKSMLETIRYLDELRQGSMFMFTLSDLDFVIRNKKLSAPAGFLANLFSIKPIMRVDETGRVIVHDKIRKIERSLNYIAEFAIRQASSGNSFMYVADSAMGAYAENFQELLASQYGVRNVPFIPVSASSLANHGPTGVGLGVYVGKNLPRITRYLT